MLLNRKQADEAFAYLERHRAGNIDGYFYRVARKAYENLAWHFAGSEEDSDPLFYSEVLTNACYAIDDPYENEDFPKFFPLL